MLNEALVHPTLSVVDLDGAKKFYGEVLGLKQIGEPIEGHVQFEAGSGTLITVFQRSDAPKAENTTASFSVKNVEAVVKWLMGRGVVFEKYDFPGLKTIDGIATLGNEKVAWFKDPAGNILGISST